MSSKFLLLSLLLSSTFITKSMEFEEDKNQDTIEIPQKDFRNKKYKKKYDGKKALGKIAESVENHLNTALSSESTKEVASIKRKLKNLKRKTEDRELSEKIQIALDKIKEHFAMLNENKQENTDENLKKEEVENKSEIKEENKDIKNEDPEEDLTSSIKLADKVFDQIKKVSQSKDSEKIDKIASEEKEKLTKYIGAYAEKKKEKLSLVTEDKEKIEKLNQELKEAKERLKSEEESLKSIEKNIQKMKTETKEIKELNIEEFLNNKNSNNSGKNCNVI